MPFDSFQHRVWQWVVACFPTSVQLDVQERNHRFLEEALELAQANACTREEAQQLVEYVFGRPTGDVRQEVGGVLVTLAALCNAIDVSMDEAGEHELDRNWSRIERIRVKQAAKPQRSALPQ
jgi:NTP pyrophosphatase (non-canonical NTP hydrolase)